MRPLPAAETPSTKTLQFQGRRALVKGGKEADEDQDQEASAGKDALQRYAGLHFLRINPKRGGRARLPAFFPFARWIF